MQLGALYQQVATACADLRDARQRIESLEYQVSLLLNNRQSSLLVRMRRAAAEAAERGAK